MFMLKFINKKLYLSLILFFISCSFIPIYNTKHWALSFSSKTDSIGYDRIFNKEIIFLMQCKTGDEGPIFREFILMSNNIMVVHRYYGDRIKYYKVSKKKYKEMLNLIQSNIDLFTKYPHLPNSCVGQSYISIMYKKGEFIFCKTNYEKDIHIQNFICNLEKIIKREILHYDGGWIRCDKRN